MYIKDDTVKYFDIVYGYPPVSLYQKLQMCEAVDEKSNSEDTSNDLLYLPISNFFDTGMALIIRVLDNNSTTK
jgi:hypothetical protein